MTNSACTVTSGEWVSPYDGRTIKSAKDVDIVRLFPSYFLKIPLNFKFLQDHVVPLKEFRSLVLFFL